MRVGVRGRARVWVGAEARRPPRSKHWVRGREGEGGQAAAHPPGRAPAAPLPQGRQDGTMRGGGIRGRPGGQAPRQPQELPHLGEHLQRLEDLIPGAVCTSGAAAAIGQASERTQARRRAQGSKSDPHWVEDVRLPPPPSLAASVRKQPLTNPALTGPHAPARGDNAAQACNSPL